MSECLQAVLMVLLTTVLYYISREVQDGYNNPLLNPAFIASIAIIIVLLVCGVSYRRYMKGGTWIDHVLNTTVVCFAYPLYQNKKKTKRYLTIIFINMSVGVVLNFVLVSTTLRILGYSKDTIVTLLLRSITATVGIGVSRESGGTDATTVLFIITTGLTGSILGSMLLHMGGFKSPTAQGLTYGNISHAFSITRALRLDIGSEALNSVNMILTAVVSSILILVLVSLFR